MSKVIPSTPAAMLPDSTAGQNRRSGRERAVKGRILVVDDEPPVRRSVAGMLQRAGFETADASSGPEALELYKKSPFDIIVSDYHMAGGMFGIDLLRAIKSLNPDAKLIFVSGGLDADEAAELVGSGAFAVLEKPLDRGPFIGTVQSALEFGARLPLEDAIESPCEGKGLLSVLFVDDDPGMLIALRDIAEMGGYAGQTACNGKEGLEIFRRRTPDVIVSDLHMPEMNGLEMLRRIKAEKPDARVIILSAESNESEMKALLDAGALSVLRKPIGIDEVISAINAAISET